MLCVMTIQSPTLSTRSLFHFAFNVTDLEEARRFYGGVLGCAGAGGAAIGGAMTGFSVSLTRMVLGSGASSGLTALFCG